MIDTMELFTIGHSNDDIQTFITRLQAQGITAIADVRSAPYSRFLPHFNRAALKEALATAAIRYVFLGQELGARPDNPACYVEGKAVYEKIAATEAFQSGLQRVLTGTQRYRLALLCAEKDPLTCHRAILVCRYLQPFGLSIHHILKNSAVESHHDLEQRLLVKHGLAHALNPSTTTQLSLFVHPTPSPMARAECLEKAYQLQGNSIAYVETQEPVHDTLHPPIHDWIHPEECANIL
jgi:hypothetical protein